MDLAVDRRRDQCDKITRALKNEIKHQSNYTVTTGPPFSIWLSLTYRGIISQLLCVAGPPLENMCRSIIVSHAKASCPVGGQR